jgi:putative flippase GtrA
MEDGAPDNGGTHLSRAWRLGVSLFLRFQTLIRYGVVGLINAAFGYGLYAGLVFIGLNLFVAQIIGQCVGTLFNYYMHKSHVFRDSRGAIVRYIGAYTINYFLSLAFLAGYHHFFPSPYFAGLLTLVTVAAINFIVLRFLVFTKRKDPGKT